jgi:hypothetical protein
MRAPSRRTAFCVVAWIFLLVLILQGIPGVWQLFL